MQSHQQLRSAITLRSRLREQPCTFYGRLASDSLSRQSQALACVPLAFVVVFSACTEATDWLRTRAAEKAITPWLATLDAGQYEEAWRQAAPELQARSSAQDWAKELQASRPGGKLVSRAVVTRAFLRRVSDKPGSYVNIASQALLEDGTRFGELMTVVDIAGTWRVHGYKIVGVRRRAP